MVVVVVVELMNYSLIISGVCRERVINFVESTQLVFQDLFVGVVDVCMYVYHVRSYVHICFKS